MLSGMSIVHGCGSSRGRRERERARQAEWMDDVDRQLIAMVALDFTRQETATARPGMSRAAIDALADRVVGPDEPRASACIICLGELEVRDCRVVAPSRAPLSLVPPPRPAPGRPERQS